MRALLASFSLPPWMWIGLGMFLCGVLFIPKFRAEIDAFLAHLMGMKPKKRDDK